MSSTLPIIVVGAGLAGLNCARILHEQGNRVLIIEAHARVGGRVQTDAVDGFQLDHGFQVFQTAYPDARLALDFANLHLTRLQAGAMIRHRDRWVRMVDPWRQPQYALATLFNSVGSLADRWRLFQLRRHVLAKSADELLCSSSDCSTREYLLGRWGFSQAFYDLFLQPWWSGVFLETELSTSAAYFQFVFHLLAAGDVALPRAGMRAIPEQLARKLPAEAIRLSTRVDRIGKHEVRLDTGEVIAAQSVVLATDCTTAAQLTAPLPAGHGEAGQLELGHGELGQWSSTTCLYFAADRPPSDSKLLMLRGDSEGPVNHLFIPTNSVPSYAPAGQSLICVSLVGVAASGERLLKSTLEHLRQWFGSQVEAWRLLRVYSLPHALPKQPPNFVAARRADSKLSDGLFRCGDYLETSSIQGALASGRKAAAAVLN